MSADDRGPGDLDPDVLPLLQVLAAPVEGGEEQVRERGVLDHQAPQRVPVDRDVAHRLRRDHVQEDGLARHQADLADEALGRVRDDLVARGVEDRGLALQDRHEGIAALADPDEDLALLGRPLLADLGELLELGVGEAGADDSGGAHARPRYRGADPAPPPSATHLTVGFASVARDSHARSSKRRSPTYSLKPLKSLFVARNESSDMPAHDARARPAAQDPIVEQLDGASGVHLSIPEADDLPTVRSLGFRPDADGERRRPVRAARASCASW